MTLRERLAALVSEAPADATVLVLWLAELLAAEGDAPVTSSTSTAPYASADLTVHDVARLFGKGTSTVRSWCIAGELVGAYKLHGHEWRVPPSAVAAMQRAHAAQHEAG